MARYLKGSLNNSWQKHEDGGYGLPPVTVIEPDTDELLIRRYRTARERYLTYREPHMLDVVNRTARELQARGITKIPS